MSQYDPVPDRPRNPHDDELPEAGNDAGLADSETDLFPPGARPNIERVPHPGPVAGLGIQSWFGGEQDVAPLPDGFAESIVSPAHNERDLRDDALIVDQQLALSMFANRFTIPADPAAPLQVAWANPNRTQLRIKVSSVGGVVIGGNAQVSNTSGYFIAASGVESFGYEGDLWVVPFTGQPAINVWVLELVRNANRA